MVFTQSTYFHRAIDCDKWLKELSHTHLQTRLKFIEKPPRLLSPAQRVTWRMVMHSCITELLQIGLDNEVIKCLEFCKQHDPKSWLSMLQLCDLDMRSEQAKGPSKDETFFDYHYRQKWGQIVRNCLLSY